MNTNPPGFKTYSHAVCLPCTGAENGPVLPGVKGGLFQADGTLIPDSLLHRQHIPVKVKFKGRLLQATKETAPVYPVQQPGKIGETKYRLNGTYIYAGLLFKHFGHFLLESLARIWFIKQHSDIPLLWVAAHRQPELSPFQKEILELLGIKNRVHILTEQSEIEEIIVPEPGYMIESHFSAAQKDALKVFDPVPLSPGKKVWLSRKNVSNGKFLNESALEEHLARNGWAVYRPEEHPVREQLLFLHDAEYIAGIAGTAHHLLIFLPGYQGTVSLFPRGPSINGDFLTIADMLQLNQTIYFQDTADCTPKLPSWMKDWCWTDLNRVLQCLNAPRKSENGFVWALKAALWDLSPRTHWSIGCRIASSYIKNKIKQAVQGRVQAQSGPFTPVSLQQKPEEPT
jgi:hypothetical protein